VITGGTSPGRWSHAGHLVRRFAGSLLRRAPSAADEVWAATWLLPGEQALWTSMANVDRRHAVVVARRFLERRPAAERAEMAGALLHDVGKVEAGLGVTGRVLATLIGPRTRRFRLYHDHEEIGAGMATDAGSDSVTVALIAGSRGAPGLDDLLAADDI
jgi:hypothetical protein